MPHDRIETSSRLDLFHYITLRLHIIRPSRLQKWKVNKPHHLPIVSPTHAEPNNTSSPTRNTTQPSPAFSAACLTTTKLPTYLSYKTKPQPTFIFSSPSFNIFTVKSTKSKHPSQITHNNSNMPSKSSTSTSNRLQAEKQKYYLITDDHDTKSSSNKSTDLQAQELWKEPYTIDDADLMFDGKPLNMLYEENRWQAEHHVVYSDQFVSFSPLNIFSTT